MKNLILSLVLLLSFSSYAFDCSKIDGKNTYVLKDTYAQTIDDNPILAVAKFDELIPGFEYISCVTSIQRDVYKIDNEDISLYYTNEDNCDGGNSYGSVVDESGEVVAVIHDGDISC
jgi:hypothetical protein